MLFIRLTLMLLIGISVLGSTITQSQQEENIFQLNQILFSNPNTGWMLGSTSNSSFIFYSTNGGKSWQNQYESKKGIYKIKFLDEEIGWAVGQDSLILHTKDGGKHWSNQFTETKEKLNSLYIISKNVAYIVGDNGVVLHTNNGGLSWTSRKLNTNLPLQNIHFVDENTGYIAGITHFFYTEDAGRNWQRKNTEYQENIFFVNFTSKSNGWIGTDDSLLKTENGGEFWQRVYIDQQGYISGPTFPNSQHGWLAKSNGSDGSIVNAEGNNDKKAVSYILSTSDGGNSWKEQLCIDSNKNHSAWILDIFFLDSINGWAVGRDNLILLTVDGGQTWQRSNNFFANEK